MYRFFSVKCAILGYCNYPALSPKSKYMINQNLLENLLCSHSKAKMKEFNKDFTKKYFNVDSYPNPPPNHNPNHKNHKKQKGMGRENHQEKQLRIETIQFLYYSEYQSKFTECLVFETIPVGDEIRKEEGMSILLLDDGVFIKKHLL
jgi:hypothetical protein